VADPQSFADEVFSDPDRFGTTYAALIVRGGDIVAERYGNELPHFDGPGTPVQAETPLLSWSIAKSVTHAAVGVLVGEGKLTLEDPVTVAEWSEADDPRRAITLEDLLTMRDGLDYLEDYVDGQTSNVIDMLFGAGQDDVAHYAASRPLKHAPGTVYNYSSGTSNIVARIVGDQVDDIEAFLRDRVFEPIGMHSATPKLDARGTFIGSSYVYATARDWIKFAQCYQHDGVIGGQRVLPKGWAEHGTRPRSLDPDNGRQYGAHWWGFNDDLGTFYASGYAGQRLLVCPPRDLVIARFGQSSADQYDALMDWCARIIDARIAT
jgi:CubicO group peptidase (beta-lactamase class C family)